MFYIQQDNKIVLFDEDKQKLQDTIAFMPQYKGLEIKEVQKGYVVYDFKLMTVEEMNEQLLLEEKNKKYEENQKALDKARTSHVFTVTLQNQECEFDTTDKTQADLNSAAISASMGQPWLWTTNNRITLSLTTEDIQIVSLAYMQSVNADIAKWTEFEEQIEQAETLETVENIVIEYNNSKEVGNE